MDVAVLLLDTFILNRLYMVGHRRPRALTRRYVSIVNQNPNVFVFLLPIARDLYLNVFCVEDKAVQGERPSGYFAANSSGTEVTFLQCLTNT